MKTTRLYWIGAITFLFSATACDKDRGAGAGTQADASAPASTGAVAAPATTGKIITVDMITDAAGSRFEPADIEAHPGDVIRYTLKTGVHNVNFLPDSNTVKTGLPAASEMLQLPGQTYDLAILFAPGKYYFQCDPHAALGMRGHVTVN